jgi:hypothetical protein
MDNYLTTLYFKLFKNREREEKLMHNTEWDDSPQGHDLNIRNDQQISEVREINKMLSNLIDEYIRNGHVN